jgi:hypothetical protein
MTLRLTIGTMLASYNTISGQQPVEFGHSAAARFCDVIGCALVAYSDGASGPSTNGSRSN